MQDFDELKNIWQQEEPKPMPEASEILARISSTKNSLAQNLLKAIVQLVPAFFVVLVIAIFIKFDSVITYTGIVIILISIFSVTERSLINFTELSLIAQSGSIIFILTPFNAALLKALSILS